MRHIFIHFDHEKWIEREIDIMYTIYIISSNGSKDKIENFQTTNSRDRDRDRERERERERHHVHILQYLFKSFKQ